MCSIKSNLKISPTYLRNCVKLISENPSPVMLSDPPVLVRTTTLRRLVVTEMAVLSIASLAMRADVEWGIVRIASVCLCFFWIWSRCRCGASTKFADSCRTLTFCGGSVLWNPHFLFNCRCHGDFLPGCTNADDGTSNNTKIVRITVAIPLLNRHRAIWYSCVGSAHTTIHKKENIICLRAGDSFSLEGEWGHAGTITIM